MATTWVDVAAVEDLDARGRVTWRKGERWLLLLRLADGEFRAIDNRCPHEGYPLSQGDVKDGLLTCAWHNWKFRLTDGACLIGGEDVRRYDVRVEAGRVLVDLVDPPVSVQIETFEASLDQAFEEDDWARAARDAERLRGLGRTNADLLGFACAWSARHGRWGFSHGLAAAADYGALMERFEDAAPALLLEAMHGLVVPNLRRAERTFAEPAVAGSPEADDGTLLRARIEDQDLAGAQASMRALIDAGTPPEVISRALTSAATDHFYDYGHGHIYVVKAEELLDRIGWSYAHPVLTSLVSTLVFGTREDTLPYMGAWRNAMAERAERATALGDVAQRDGVDVDVDAFLAAVLGPELEPALDVVLAALEDGLAPERAALLLGVAAAIRLARFDSAIDADEAVSDGWLHATHLLTHADAVRASLRRHPGADAVRGLFHSARFVQHAHVLDGDGGGADPAADPAALETALLESCMATPLVLPIFVQHHVKTVLAAVRLARAAAADPLVEASLASLPLVAADRFLRHPQRERRFRSTAEIARAFIQEGRIRPSLLGY